MLWNYWEENAGKIDSKPLGCDLQEEQYLKCFALFQAHDNEDKKKTFIKISIFKKLKNLKRNFVRFIEEIIQNKLDIFRPRFVEEAVFWKSYVLEWPWTPQSQMYPLYVI